MSTDYDSESGTGLREAGYGTLVVALVFCPVMVIGDTVLAVDAMYNGRVGETLAMATMAVLGLIAGCVGWSEGRAMLALSRS